MNRRVEQLRDQMQEEGLGAYYVSNPFNVRYLSGFTGEETWLLITLADAFLITDFRYLEQAREEAIDFDVLLYGKNAPYDSVIACLNDKLLTHSIHRLGYEDEDLTVAAYDVLEEQLTSELIPSSGMIELLRQTKDAIEIATITKACEIADEAFQYILGYIEPGITEIEVANALDFKMRELGASKVSFETIVASGYRSAMPHGVATHKKIQRNELVTLDFGCYYEGYVSDMTRTIAVGDVVSQLKDIYRIVQEANQKVREQAKPGMMGRELEHIARDYIASAGYGEQFGHSLGHSIGLEIHEEPNANLHSEDILKVNQLITDEPGIYIAGLGGVRIEDDLLFTEDGCRTLTHSSRELIQL
ncbi:MAG: aminopeptidase P family protein [Aerococcus sp.]|nr:aminopeptidase P family protein [Aerococcus sp.]